jgi:type II secretory pathway pseudopilin PulG
MKKDNKLSAFTVLEITIVLALTSLLTALFFGALNRFNMTMANETKIKNELNQLFLFRSNLWRELDEADSIKVENNVAQLFNDKNVITYSGFESQTKWEKGETSRLFNLEIEHIEMERVNGNEVIDFMFIWRQDELNIYFPLKQDARQVINTYFNEEQWR